MQYNESNKKKILELWESTVRRRCPEINNQGKIELLDHLPQFLDRLFAALRKEEYKSEIKEATKVSKIHGEQRSANEDYSLAEVLREYSILRSCVMEVLGGTASVSAEDQQIIHRLIDEAGIIAGTVFSESRMLIDECLNIELKRSNQELEQFAAIAAHDLRSPIATLSGFVDIIQDEFPNPNDEMKKIFSSAQSCAERMLTLIERLLSYAKLGHSEPHIEDLDLNEVIANVLTSIGESIKESNSKIIYKNLPRIRADASVVQQLFQNLIGNSIKFKGTDSPLVTVSLDDEDGAKWTFSVTDNGIGFDEKESESIFEPFKQLNNTNEYKGSGLGLATVKRAVDILGGKIWCESKIGVGSKFIFTISKHS
jgi:signal transduction histidine kinase